MKISPFVKTLKCKHEKNIEKAFFKRLFIRRKISNYIKKITNIYRLSYFAKRGFYVYLKILTQEKYLDKLT